jgi:hypothetical protein
MGCKSTDAQRQPFSGCRDLAKPGRALECAPGPSRENERRRATCSLAAGAASWRFESAVLRSSGRLREAVTELRVIAEASRDADGVKAYSTPMDEIFPPLLPRPQPRSHELHDPVRRALVLDRG